MIAYAQAHNVTKVVIGKPERPRWREAVFGSVVDELIRRSGDIDVYVTRFRPMMNTLSDKTDRMLLKLVVRAEDQRVLGIHILGPTAAEIIQMAAIALGMNATKADLDRTFAMHPTAGEELVTFKTPSYRYRGGVKV